MTILFQQTTIIDNNSPFHLQVKDVLVENGIITKIEDQITTTGEMMLVSNHFISPGWVDMQCNFKDPGEEHKEGITNGVKAAAAGGFTRVCLQSSTTPVIDSKTQVEYIQHYNRTSPIFIHAIGAATLNREGKELAELYDMHLSGCVAFSDDKRPIENPKLLELALTYVKNFNGLIIHFPTTKALTQHTQMHEGIMSTSLGFKGNPSLAEALAVTKDNYLVNYTSGKIHYNLISTHEAVTLIKDAKAKNDAVTCGVAAHQLYFTDDILATFDTIHKVNPPYRSTQDKESLLKGLKENIIDVICSDHSPEDKEHKYVEFEYAAFGISAVQTCFSVAHDVLYKSCSIDEIIPKFAHHPRKILQLPPATIAVGNEAEITCFNPKEEFILTENNNYSASDNSPFFNIPLTGKVIGVYCKNNWISTK